MNDITVALIGNPNTGKTSLINSLTGLSLHVGNWPGKTVQKKEGSFKSGQNLIHLVDLPGTYSVKPYSEEEKVTDDFLKYGHVDVVIQVIDVNVLARNLIMTHEIVALGKKVVLAFNFNTEAKKRGLKIDLQKICQKLSLPVVAIEANKGINKKKLIETVIKVSQQDFCRPSYLSSLLDSNKKNVDREKALDFFNKEISPFYDDNSIWQKIQSIDRIVMNKFTAFPVFLLVMFLIFKLIFTISNPLISTIGLFFEKIAAVMPTSLPPLLHSFITGGLIGGIGTVLSFAPLIFTLFIMIAIIEDSGYLGRTVVLSDRFFQKFGISGHSFIPMILGFGCNVPAILATRTIKNHKERLIAILTNSFISCGARLPVYALFAGIFFPNRASVVIFGLYFLGILVNLTASAILARFIKNNESATLILELPPYRMPVFSNVLKHAWYHTRGFIQKASTTIFFAVIIIWFFASIPFGVDYGSRLSLAGKIGEFISPIFQPLGFSHWTYTISLLFGISAKEIIIGTLGTLHSVSADGLIQILPQTISKAGALSFLVFVSLYTPCVAAISVMKKETGKWKYAIIQPLTTIVVAWLFAFATYRIALAFIP
ncbi:ferrous iron transport protein B [Candidatus Berkelbacteria bacterium CG10_big_fil_rev_8_21_14_0_10_43_13]|uniref:Ferrous iron transport protein B n=1 Tax=Candidatus Berkelbacteria bacterium CG10_big_fil_rev_8_21_14_0_10_43_13 TaxID=1974514 RepID=A0A2H0W5Y0_9BACT|nr:MAG: ferrous iron transport protein B [Candidatus Berkelbacteria bacterium CG10_big_fil_rev_8_21_14_0_10_43_13]